MKFVRDRVVLEIRDDKVAAKFISSIQFAINSCKWDVKLFNLLMKVELNDVKQLDKYTLILSTSAGDITGTVVIIDDIMDGLIYRIDHLSVMSSLHELDVQG